MSYLVSRLARAARLPHSLARRPTAKAVLLSLADHCFKDDGTEAFPAIATMARECEVSRRTVHAHLQALALAGLIVEQRPPTQHRPRTWQLDLVRICALLDVQAVASLKDSDRQLVASLTTREPFLPFDSEVQPVAPLRAPEVQLVHPEVQPVAPERYEHLEQKKYSGEDAATRRLSREPNGDNFKVIKALAIDVLQTTDQHHEDLVEAVKQRCADLQIDYGRHAAVPFDVVHRACAWAEYLHRLKATHGHTVTPQRTNPLIGVSPLETLRRVSAHSRS